MMGKTSNKVKAVSLDMQREYIEEIAPSYSEERWELRNNVARELEVILPYATGEPVLELGAGAGVVLEILQATGRRAYGIEVVQGMLHEAVDRGVKGMIQADGAGLPFADDSFGLVTLWGNTLGPIPGRENRVALLQEAKRVLRPDAPLALSVLNRWAGPRRLLNPLEFEISARSKESALYGYNRYYSFRQVKAELGDAGFTRYKRLSGLRDSALVLLAW